MRVDVDLVTRIVREVLAERDALYALRRMTWA